ncbi:MAG: hypothetical protein SV375_06785 [Thermodesulfobacteriota bacterium]|nr:hypothetical protein [Thermodesulfobacteriota bacterium]
MKKKEKEDRDTGFSTTASLLREGLSMDNESFELTERIEEIMMMCDREQPVYEQISSFSIALYTLGFFNCPDLMSFQDVDAHEAASILNDDFMEIRKEALPSDYCITASKERYLLVIGDPLFPIHFAVFVNALSPKPYFSKLPFFGAGFDSLEELEDEFAGIDGVTSKDIYFFKKIRYGEIPLKSRGKIYIIKND